MTVFIVMRTSEWLIQTLFCLRMGVRLCRQLAYSILSRHIKNFQGDFISWSTLFCTYYLFGLYPTLLVFVQKATRQTYDLRKLYALDLLQTVIQPIIASIHFVQCRRTQSYPRSTSE